MGDSLIREVGRGVCPENGPYIEFDIVEPSTPAAPAAPSPERTKTMTKADPIATAEQAEVARAEGWKARAEKNVADRKALESEFAADAPRTAVGAQALAEVKAVLADRSGSALDRIRARREGRAVTAD